jgi:hypothetical protein
MDKSEGTDFISKTFSSFTDTVARWYHKQQKGMTVSQLKRTREEKIAALGHKVAELLKENKLTAKALENEYLSIVQIDEAIAQTEADIKKLSSEKEVKEVEAAKPKRGRKKADVDKADKEVEAKPARGRRKAADKEGEPAKKTAGRKPAAAKKPAAKTATKPVTERKRRAKKIESKPLEIPMAERQPVESDKLPAHFEENN